MSDLYLYKVDSRYLKFLHSIDHRVSVKYNNRPFVGVITMVNGIKYLLPLTSQTTDERIKSGKKKRSSKITTFIRDGKGKEISNILYNNMIPLKQGTYSLLNINPMDNSYESNEIRFIRKNRDTIINKAKFVYNKRIENNDTFFQYICCDFQLLEREYMEFI